MLRLTGKNLRNIAVLALIMCALAPLFVFTIVGRASTAQNSQTQRSTVAPTASPEDVPPVMPTPKPKPSPTPAGVDDNDVEVVRVTSNLVMVPVSVVDAGGQPVLGLKQSDFTIEEEGHAQEIAQIGDPDQVPLDIAVLFDASSSVRARHKFQQEAAAGFIKQLLKPIDHAAIFSIKEQPVLEQQLASADVAAAKLLKIQAAMGPTPTAFYDTIIRAAHYLAENSASNHRRVILTISDGEDNFSEQIRDSSIAEAEALGRAQNETDRQRVRASRRKSQEELHRRALVEVQREVERADAVFYSINPSGPSYRLNEISTRAENGMEKLADTTGGSAFVLENLEDLPAAFRQIAGELRSQYLLQYYSGDESSNGRYLHIKVGVPTHPNLRVRARQGYYTKRR